MTPRPDMGMLGGFGDNVGRFTEPVLRLCRWYSEHTGLSRVYIAGFTGMYWLPKERLPKKLPRQRW